MKKFADDYAYDVLTDDTDEYKPKDKDVKDLDSEDKDLDFELGEVIVLEKTSPKGFSASKCDVGNWIFSKFWEFFEKLILNFLDFLKKNF